MSKVYKLSTSVLAVALATTAAGAGAKDAAPRFDAGAISGLSARNIG